MTSIRAAVIGDLRKHMAAEIKGAERAVTAAMRQAGKGLKADWRRQIESAGLGSRLARTIRDHVYPQNEDSVSAAALVWTKAPAIIGAHDRGALIRAKDGFWLAIPTEAAGKSRRGGRIAPGEWEQRTGIRLRFIYRPGRPGLLVADLRVRKGKRGGFAPPSARTLKTGRDLATVVLFILVPQVKLRKRLDIDRLAAQWLGRLPGLIIRNWRNTPAGD